MRKGTIPIGAFVGIGIFFETLILLHSKYIAKRPSTTRDTKISDEVAQAMADKIIKERRNTEKQTRGRVRDHSKAMFLNNSNKLSALFIFLWLIIACADSGIIEGGKFSSSQKTVCMHSIYMTISQKIK